MNLRRPTVSILIALAIFFIVTPSVFAQQYDKRNIEGLFDDRINYDVYFNSGENETTIARSVEILRFEEIAGRTFLVVRAAGFNLKEQEGFILFDSISAILPGNNFKVQYIKNTKHNY